MSKVAVCDDHGSTKQFNLRPPFIIWRWKQ